MKNVQSSANKVYLTGLGKTLVISFIVTRNKVTLNTDSCNTFEISALFEISSFTRTWINLFFKKLAINSNILLFMFHCWSR